MTRFRQHMTGACGSKLNQPWVKSEAQPHHRDMAAPRSCSITNIYQGLFMGKRPHSKEETKTKRKLYNQILSICSCEKVKRNWWRKMLEGRGIEPEQVLRIERGFRACHWGQFSGRALSLHKLSVFGVISGESTDEGSPQWKSEVEMEEEEKHS